MILWFYLVVTWNGDVLPRHGFKDMEACDRHRSATARQFSGTVRDITDCIGVPIKGERN